MIVLLQKIGSMKVYVYLFSVGVGGVCPSGIEAFGFLAEAVRS